MDELNEKRIERFVYQAIDPLFNTLAQWKEDWKYFRVKIEVPRPYLNSMKRGLKE